ncbi:hypothetical protein [Dyadobacter sp. CY312]|uniref:hypothetical protein n=1 Tax=Dyadobacter sp. CY312 TaxID=2907303 RepID=UPI001F166022|nr:hypothetical protein [Dyadobacter sp. CY312]MCE7042683.1 hypothetical protein [Dyadobacter sp. CY312]
MARNREPQIFNISFLDVICGALGAVIFLFIAVPKGGSSPANRQQVTMSYDTLHQHLFATISDSLKHKRPGDTLLVVLADYKELPGLSDCPTCPECPETASLAENQPYTQAAKPSQTGKSDSLKTTPEPPKQEDVKRSKYLGDPPGVPCKVSFEVNWTDIGDNVDLFVCKGTKCVSGGAREIRDIGQWDSGKAKTKFFGSDLRTTQEAVRQFDKIIPGEYKLYARLKESVKNNASVNVRGLVYSRNENGEEKGEPFSATLQLNAERVLLGTVTMPDNGNFQLVKN